MSGKTKEKTMAKTHDKKTPVVVTTEHKGVFFGWTENADADPIKLTDARLCVYWSTDVKGFMGLAGKGPTKSCKIGPPALSIRLPKVTSVIECTDEAVKAWEAAPWG